MSIELYNMQRGGETVAQVVHLESGKCVVSWPTSVIVYDTLQMAKAVHIQHMGGRGEKTKFVAIWSDSQSFMRGWHDAGHDDIEGAPFASATDNYKRDTITAPDWKDMDPESWKRGYIEACDAIFGLGWRLVMREIIEQQRRARNVAVAAAKPAERQGGA